MRQSLLIPLYLLFNANCSFALSTGDGGTRDTKLDSSLWFSELCRLIQDFFYEIVTLIA